MLPWVRIEVATVTLIAIIVTCAHGLKIDFSRLAGLHRPNLLKRNDMCTGNPCPAGKPFMCRSSPTCIALKFVCDKNYDCEDGFDEDPAVCFASFRPDTDSIFNLIDHEKKWMLPKLFNGAAPFQVAHALTEAADMEELRLTLGLTDENVQNLRTAFTCAMEGDERPLLAMGMGDRQWHEVQHLFEQLLNSGFKP